MAVKSKYQTVVQSHKECRPRRERIFLFPLSLRKCPTEGGDHIKGECYHTWIRDLLCLRWPWTEISLGFKVTAPQDLYAKIHMRNLYLPASRLGWEVSLPNLDFSSLQIESSWQPGIATTQSIMEYRNKPRIHNRGMSNGWEAPKEIFQVFRDQRNANQKDLQILPYTNQYG